MANEVGYQHVWTGSTLYAIVLDLLGRAWNGAAFETRVVANWGNYDVALAESEAGSYWYAGTFPAAIPDGAYTVLMFERAGAAPAATDELLGTGRIQWESGAEVAPASPADLERTFAADREALPAEVYFADGTNGNDANDGRSRAAAKLTLGAALALINPATAVRPAIVAVGSFAATLDLSALPPILLTGSAALMYGGAPPLTTCDDLMVRGWTIERSGTSPAIALGGTVGTRTFEGCQIVANDGLGGISTILTTRVGDTVVFRRCVLYGDLDATVGRIVLDRCTRLAGADTGNVVYTSDIASREASGAAAAAAVLIRGGTRDLADLATPGDVADGNAALATAHGEGSWLSEEASAGAVTDTFTVEDEGHAPVDGADVWVSTDEAGEHVTQGPVSTNDMGEASFSLDVADGYWVHAQVAGHAATGYPREFNVTAEGFEWA